MTIAARTGFIGLVTNVACTQAPAGGLNEAENVVIRRPGCVEPREGVSLLEASTYRVAYGLSTPDTDVYASYTGGAFVWTEVGGTTVQYTDPVDGAVDPQPFRRDIWCHAQSRGNTYVPASNGVYKLADDASEFTSAGLPPYALVDGVVTAVGGSWLLNTYSTAYRAVAKRIDSDGLIVRSSPSGSLTVTNTAGADRLTQVSMSYDAQFNGLFTSVEVYRSRIFASGETVDDEMQLVADVDVSVFSLSGGVYEYTLTDSVLTEDRGATLYTSPSRGGISYRNNAPPAAACIAAYKGSLFFGNIRGPQVFIASVYNQGNLTGTATGVGYRSYTGDRTNGSPTILNMSSTVGLEKGMLLVVSGFPEGSYVTNISGTTITMSQNADGTTAAGAGLLFSDAIKVDGVWVISSQYGGAYAAYMLAAYGTGRMIAYTGTPPKGGSNVTIIFESTSRASGLGNTIQATHGESYDPPLPNYDGTPEPFSQDEYPGGIVWSKQDQPEHVAPVAYAFVGDKNKAILGLVPTRDALFILKEDGVFRLTGSGATEGVASPWRIDPYDPTTFCVLPSSIKPLNGRCYFLSQRGVVAFGDGGAELVSAPVADKFRNIIDYVRNYKDANGVYELDGVIGSSAAVFARESEYTIMRSDSQWPLVYNENTRAWTEWRYHYDTAQTYLYRCLFSFDRLGRVIYGLDTTLYQTRLSTDSVASLPQLYDGSSSITVSAWNSGTGALTLTSGAISCLADDVVVDADGLYWRVTTDVDGSSTVYVDGLTAYPYGGAQSFTTGACTIYRSLRCRVAGSTFFGQPWEAKVNERVSAMFSRFQGPVALRFAFKSQMTPVTDAYAPIGPDNWEVESAFALPLLDGSASYINGFSADAVTPNSHARAWLIDVGVRWVAIDGYARLEGIYLSSRDMTSGDQQVSA